jgi:hypothetical protein
MAQTLLLNPRRRKARRKNPSPAQLRARAKFAAMSRARSRAGSAAKRRRNPARAVYPEAMGANPRRRRARRRNPSMRAISRIRRYRRNPIGGINVNGIMNVIKDAAVQGAGAVAMDIGYSSVARYLPASMQAGPGQATLGSAVKMIITAVAGKVLAKHTRGLSQKAALGALTVQARDIVAGLLPAGTVAGLGYAVPGVVINRSARIGPNRGMGQYTNGRTPLLSAYTSPGSMSPLLSGQSAREREGFQR